ncbi:unnamed protein product [Ixodes pacificus]
MTAQDTKEITYSSHSQLKHQLNFLTSRQRRNDTFQC